MAYFIVIGTNNDVKCVVDEMKNAHLQHNIVTSGCILFDEQNAYYHWDVYNASGKKTGENDESIELHDALTNQIAQFKTLLPANAIPNVFVVSNCYSRQDCESLQLVCSELYKVGGTMLSGILVDIVLLGYDLNNPENVTRRPHWKELEFLRGLGVASPFHTDIMYLNNMDLMGTATNINSKLLGRFLCHWSKMVSSGGNNPKAAVNSRFYSIGISEHQYDFQDLNDFFALDAESKLLDRTLNNPPSPDTQVLIDYKYFDRVDLSLPWIDGLLTIKTLWNSYCSSEWDTKKHLADNIYSVTRQELELATYLNQFLRLYIEEEKGEIYYLNEEIRQKEIKIESLNANLLEISKTDDENDPDEDPSLEIRQQIERLQYEIDGLRKKIQEHKENIEKNTFLDADEFCDDFGCTPRITKEDEEKYNSYYDNVMGLVRYAKTDAGVSIMRESIKRATADDILPQWYPDATISNIGFVEQRESHKSTPESPKPPIANTIENEDAKLEDNPGCLMWFKGLFSKKKEKSDSNPAPAPEPIPSPSQTLDIEHVKKSLLNNLNNTVAALKRADSVRSWWGRLCAIVKHDQARLEECRLLMDGEKTPNGDYIEGREGYHPPRHVKSISLIDMSLVRNYRNTDPYYSGIIDKFLDRWFDKSIDLSKRMTMQEQIKQQILDPLLGKFHTLKWDGSNPFVDEIISDEDMQDYINYDLRQSKPFAEYVRLQDYNITSNFNIAFFSNNQNIPYLPNDFRNNYSVASDTIVPVCLTSFVNSMCVVQVMDIPDHIDALKDFKPKREYELSSLKSDISNEVNAIVGAVTKIEDKVKAIYDWLCDNIAYDTTKQIHDAETCWKMRRGVCQAYCELFCYMAESVGVTAEVIVGKTKNEDGIISDEKHAWIFVYTHGYEGMLIDPTWGAGGIDGVKFVKNSDRSIWYDVSPYWMIFSHFPDQEYWTKLDIEITEEQFEGLPFMLPSKASDGGTILFEELARIQK